MTLNHILNATKLVLAVLFVIESAFNWGTPMFAVYNTLAVLLLESMKRK